MKPFEQGRAPHGGPGQSQGGRGGRESDDSLSATAARTARTVKEGVKEGFDDVADTMSSTLGAARRKANETHGSASRYASSAGRSSYYGYRRARFETKSFVSENPIMVGVVGVAAGLILGALLPGTRKENEYFGRYADDVRDQGLRYARDIAEQGRQYVEENIEQVKAEFKGGGQDPAQGSPAPQGPKPGQPSSAPPQSGASQPAPPPRPAPGSGQV